MKTQESNETLEEQKKWLVGRVLQQEMDSSDLEQAIADLQAQLSERDSRIASLETEVHFRFHTHHFVEFKLQIRMQGSYQQCAGHLI